tara:strand:- start:7165 stop:7821 length:657 start_codon:yes stop_codon:yes gene_type:complete
MKHKILVIGGAGFIGYNFIDKCLNKKMSVINIDPLKYSANKKEILKFNKNKNYFFYKKDMNDKVLIKKVLNDHDITTIINFASESHVDNSIDSPKYFFTNNCVKFIDFLDALQNYYHKLDPNKKKRFKFLYVSTDEVYGSLLLKEKPFNEHSNLKPNNPYSSSKAAAELILRSFSNTYNFPYMISNCSNNYGKFQNDEKLIPTIFRNAIKKKKNTNLW